VGSLGPKDAEKQRGVIYALAPSFKNINTLWAGTDDGLIWLTRDGGKKWSDITPPELTPWSKVTQISASHFDDETAYASVSRFRIDDERLISIARTTAARLEPDHHRPPRDRPGRHGARRSRAQGLAVCRHGECSLGFVR
jgi:hypothetical protein